MYYNPVKVVETNNWREQYVIFQEKLKIHNPLIITTNGNLKRHDILDFFDSSSIFSTVKPNPTFEDCKVAIAFSEKSEFDGVIAIGGGSVMDMAKVIMASMGTGIHNLPELFNITDPNDKIVPSIFVPTTHGTGSEVTMWGTIWNIVEKKKYSISNPSLYPSVAILDSNLTLSLPLKISIITVMDALSHSFEAIWNKNANSKSTDYAIEAISLILQNIEALKLNPVDVRLRSRLLRAANLAGLAFSNTKTAAAHSMSYPLTIHYGVPHGVASSITLVSLLEINASSISNVLEKIYIAVNLVGLQDLIKKIKSIPANIVSYRLKDWCIKKDDINWLVDQSFTKGRMDNNIVELTKNDVHYILKSLY